jgi:hypothetical protein
LYEGDQVTEPSSEFGQALQLHPIQFSLDDRTFAQVCGHKKEPEWVLNLKKGIISALQSSVHPSQLGVNVTEVNNLFAAI